MTSAHDLAVSLQASIKGQGFNSSVLVINPECLQIDFHAFDGMPTVWLVTEVQTAGWHVSIEGSAAGTFSFTLEPAVQQPQAVPDTLFHATRKVNLPLIGAIGITLSSKAGTWTNRSYPTPRSFHARSKWDAFVFIASHVTEGPIQNGLPVLGLDVLEDWELLAVKNTKAHNFHRDPIMIPSVWTDSTIPPGSLARVKGWRQEYAQAAEWNALDLANI